MDYYYSDDIKEEVKGFILSISSSHVSSPNISIKLIKSFKVAKVSLCLFKSKLVIIDSKIAAISSDR